MIVTRCKKREKKEDSEEIEEVSSGDGTRTLVMGVLSPIQILSYAPEILKYCKVAI